MRILSIQLANLNSLTGTWSIDFTHQEYRATGIFAITGPTGSGKSTILDGLCLALYGRTPRLSNITKGSNEIMSRRTGECFAEVEFETIKGRYRSHWSQHRARKKPGGELQPPKHEIVDSSSGKVLETKVKEVRARVEALTGMDFDRFTRSMLLAQGGFAAFLQAEPAERAPLLEQITGTEIYSRISMAVHEQNKDHKEQTALLEAELGAIELLSSEEEQALNAELKGYLQRAGVLQQKLQTTLDAERWLDTCSQLQKQREELAESLQSVTREKKEAEPQLLCLARGLKAQEVFPAHARLEQEKNRLQKIEQEQLEKGREKKLLTRELPEIEKGLVKAQGELEQVQAAELGERKCIQLVRPLDTRIFVAQKQHQEQQQQVEGAIKAMQQQSVMAKEHTILQKKTTEALEKQQSWCEQQSGGPLLVEQFALICKELEELQQLVRNKEGKEQEHASHKKQEKNVNVRLESLIREDVNSSKRNAALQAEKEELQADFDRVLAGQKLKDLRRQGEQQGGSVQLLEHLTQMLQTRQKLVDQNGALNQGQELLLAEQKKIRLQVEGTARAKVIQEKLLLELERSQRLAEKIHSYEEERKLLDPDCPCPLCGSLDHPWKEEQPPTESQPDQLQCGQKELAVLVKEERVCRENLVAVDKDIEHSLKTILAGKQEIKGLQQDIDVLVEQVGITVEPETLQQQVDTLLLAGIERMKLLQQAVAEGEKLEELLLGLEKKAAEIKEEATKLNTSIQEAKHAQQDCWKDIELCQQALTELEKKITGSNADLELRLRPLAISHTLPQGAEHLIHTLSTRKKQWEQGRQQVDRLQQEVAGIAAELLKIETMRGKVEGDIQEKETRFVEISRELEGLMEEREKMYGDRNPEVEEQRFRTLVKRKDEVVTDRRKVLEQREKQLHGLRETLAKMEKEHRILTSELADLDRLVEKQVLEAGFTGRTDFTKALLAKEKLQELQLFKEKLYTREAECSARYNQVQVNLDKETARQLTAKTLESLGEEKEHLKKELEGVQQLIGAGKERLAKDAQQRLQQQGRLQILAVQQEKSAEWGRLHELIGSADGKKFRMFAQGLTFDVVIDHANQQLAKMHDRYILIRDSKQPLELQVIDNYQAGETRSTRNLSGGESFIVSLALSLGLSSMVSRTVRVDSLFLDEGFGTLDDEALDIALQTLAGMHQEGRLIGIISHVQMIKDRINTRIQVEPGMDGCSTLLGPGCSGNRNRLAPV